MESKIAIQINKLSIDIILLILSIIQLAFIPDKLFLLFRYAVILYLFCKYFNRAKHDIINGLLLFYTIVLSVSTIINTSSITWFVSAFMTGIQYITVFNVFSLFGEKNSGLALVKLLIKIFFILILINDLLIFIVNYNFSNPDEKYLIGNKFLVSYYHCLFCCLLFVKSDNKYTTFLFAFYTMLIASTVTCSTGIIISIVLIFLLIIPQRLKKILEKPYFLMFALLLGNFLIWSPINIFKNPIIINIITDIFKKSANMTGRENLYKITFDLVARNPLIGYGHNTDIYRNILGYGNAQNGLFHIIIQSGLIGAFIYFYALIKGLKIKYPNLCYGMFMYLYAMLVGSAIEINLSMQFLMGVAVVYAFKYEKSK